jgi:hypothetical protein
VRKGCVKCWRPARLVLSHFSDRSRSSYVLSHLGLCQQTAHDGLSAAFIRAKFLQDVMRIRSSWNNPPKPHFKAHATAAQWF